MNISKLIKDILRNTGLPVEQDEYDGKKTEYIIFTYEDEVPTFHGDDTPLAETAYIQIQLVTPKSYSYEAKKKEIKSLLRANGFLVISTRSFLGSAFEGAEKVRQTVFTATYTSYINKEE